MSSNKKNYLIIKKSFIYILCFIVISPNFTACKYKKLSRTSNFFDTTITITIYDGNEKILDSSMDLCKKYEKIFSSKINNSDISKINKNSKNGKYTKVSNETLDLINTAMYYGDLSNGNFDITIGALTDLWDFKEHKIPEKNEINKAISSVNYNNIDIKDNKILLTDKSAKIDLGGIAKGYIADKLKEHLISNGIKSGIINLGGNILLIGEKNESNQNNDKYFNIGLQKPFSDTGDTILTIKAKDTSIVTSGTYQRYFYDNDILYHHILDTKTGYPVNNSLNSVTIINKSSTICDALSTLTFTYGLEDGIKLIESLDDTEAIFVMDNNEIYYTSGLKLNDGVVTIGY